MKKPKETKPSAEGRTLPLFPGEGFHGERSVVGPPIKRAEPVKCAEPPIKWVGSKRQLLPELLARVPESCRRYHEPFAGGAALFWRLHALGRLREGAVLSDLNPHLINAYAVIAERPGDLVHGLSGMRYDRAEYYERRDMFNYFIRREAEHDGRLISGGLIPAALFLYLNKTCYNGLWRVNRAGEFNVPFGKYKNPTLVDHDNLHACSEALRGRAMLSCQDFEAAIDAAAEGDFVYGDPPYVPLTATSDFTGYCAQGFSMADQVRLRDAALRAKQRDVHVLLSNSSAPAVFDLYQPREGWKIEIVEARRSVNCRAEKRGAVKEVLIS